MKLFCFITTYFILVDKLNNEAQQHETRSFELYALPRLNQ